MIALAPFSAKPNQKLFRSKLATVLPGYCTLKVGVPEIVEVITPAAAKLRGERISRWRSWIWCALTLVENEE